MTWRDPLFAHWPVQRPAVAGRYVVPGLIDPHMHVFGNDGSIAPDDTALPAGTTTIVDAGGSGCRTLDQFRRTVIAHSKTRVLALINIVGAAWWASRPRATPRTWSRIRRRR
jgi:predicted amidohydrolase